MTYRTRELAGLAIAVASLAVLYHDVLVRLVDAWTNDGNYSHGFLIAPLAGYFAWERRDRLARAVRGTSALGLLVVAGSLAVLVVGILGSELFLTRISLVGAIVGSVLFLFGWQVIRILTFPLGILLLMIPLPAIIFNQITFPLQLLATRMAEVFLSVFGYPVLREGNVLHLASQSLNVVEACSGIRSLLSLTFISLIYAHFFDNKPWMKIALLLCVIPIALFANAMRVTLTGIVSEIDPTLAEGIFHSLEGLVLFALDLVALVAIHKLINKIYSRTQHAKAPVTVAS